MPPPFPKDSSLIQHLTAADFDNAIASSRTVLVDFWADWCGPCKALAPMLDDLADAYGEAVRVAKVDVVANDDLASRFAVRGIPMLLLFRDGQEVERVVGTVSRVRLAALIDRYLA